MKNNHNNGKTIAQALLINLSLLATFLFLMGLGSGFSAALFAAGGVLIQLSALLYLPSLVRESWSNGRALLSIVSAIMLAMVLLISVAGSVSILSGLSDSSVMAAGERARIQKLIESKQTAADEYIALQRMRQALPILEEVEAHNKELGELPAPSGFYLAAERVSGKNAQLLITVLIVILSIGADLMVLLLGVDPGKKNDGLSVRESNEVVEQNPVPETTVIKSDTASEYRHKAEPGRSALPFPELSLVRAVTPKSNAGTKSKEVGTEDEKVMLEHSVVAVMSALKDSQITEPSIRQVRGLLKCSQGHAVEVSRETKMRLSA